MPNGFQHRMKCVNRSSIEIHSKGACEEMESGLARSLDGRVSFYLGI